MTRVRLTPKQSRFVDEYLIDLNATQAAIRAGYSEKTARQVGAENLSKPDIATAIDDRVQERSERTQVDANYVLQRLVEIDQMDVIDILDDDGRLKPLRDWPRVWRTTISALDLSELWEGHGDERQLVGLLKKVKWPDKPKNLELLGKHVTVQAWKEQRELSGRLTTTHEEALEALE
ncbi:terminase small subunit [Halomonas aquatica]|uniref:Terminase small subunit n=1 Tax=Halomonas aquatica TaxID=3151123 RepID=A0ABV1NGV2_9GAMM